MINKFYDYMLHNITKHTNLAQPYSDYVRDGKFPTQYGELLNSEVILKYRYQYIIDRCNQNDSPAELDIGNGVTLTRPEDDLWITKNPSNEPDKYDDNDVFTDKFTIVRADSSAPFLMIAICFDYKKIVIGSTEKDSNGEFKFLSDIHSYPIQFNEYIGLACRTQSSPKDGRLKAVTMRVDSGEPCEAVLIEFLSSNVIRFIIGEEAVAILDDYYDLYDKHNFDAKDANEKGYGIPTDVDGYTALHSGIKTEDVDGGPAWNWANLGYSESTMTDFEVVKFRKDILEGKTIYGSI